MIYNYASTKNHLNPLKGVDNKSIKDPDRNKSSIKIGTINISGLKALSNSSNKKISYIHSLQQGILLIQETHSDY